MPRSDPLCGWIWCGGVVALTVATLTVLLAVRQLFMVGSGIVFSRYVAVGGLVAFSIDRGDSPDASASIDEHVRFDVGGPGVSHSISVQLFGAPEPAASAALQPPAVRHTMAAGDAPIEWTFRLPDEVAEQAWLMVTWVRPYLQGVESEALAQWLGNRPPLRVAVVLRNDPFYPDNGSVRRPAVVGARPRVDARAATVRAVAAYLVQ